MTEPEYPFAVRPLSAEEGGGFLIEFPDLPGCISDGETVAEAIANGMEAKADWSAAMIEAGRPIPSATPGRAEQYSGEWQLRTPRTLHKSLAVALLAEGLGQRGS